ncbi:MAG: CotH kinase family protein [Candidatus Sumerlaeia bacterium]|nr:CotH kinase family protein [Candidatus Sumerlaeia bacterium]
MASNGNAIFDEDEDSSDWIELFNPASKPIDLTGYYLSDNPANRTRWQFPSVEIPGGEYLVVWASGKDRRDGAELHTNFSISSSGEPLLLVAPDGATVVDSIPGASLPANVARGRFPGEPSRIVYFRTATPGMANDGEGYDGYLEPPRISQVSGFHTSDVEVHIEHPNPTARIFYTLDGSMPTLDSDEYLGGLQVTDRSGDDNYFANIPTNYFPPEDDIGHRPPAAPIAKATVVRARAFHESLLESSTAVATYFVFPEGAERYHLPVLPLVVSPEDFFDDTIGIYVPGIHGDPDSPVSGNFQMGGAAWERPVHFEYFDADGTLQVAQWLGARIHGGWTRRFPQKNLRLYAREGYGNPYIEHRLFPQRDDEAFRRIVLRGSGNEWLITHIRDATVHRVVEHMNIATLGYQPSIAFLNGEFWGLHNIRERYDRHYLARRKGVEPERIDYLTGNATVDNGSAEHYEAMLEFIREHDLSLDENISRLAEMMDIENYIDYCIAQIFHANIDWPHNNIDYWRLQADHDPTMPAGRDGRWRWLLYDVDVSYGLNTKHPHDTIEWVTDRINPRTGEEWPNLILRGLLDNDAVRVAFLNRLADNLNTTFLPDRIVGIIDEYADNIRPVMQEVFDRWNERFTIPFWEFRIGVMKEFAYGRPESLRGHVRNHFGIERDVALTVELACPAEEGQVRVNTLLLDPSTPGVPEETFPWSGSYFSGIPIELTGIPSDGYRFAHWTTDSLTSGTKLLSMDRLMTLAADHDTTVTAHFEPAATGRPMHYWNFNDGSALLEPGYTTGGGKLEIALAGESAYSADSGQGFEAANARFNSPAGTHLRVNEPLGAALTFRLPTVGFSDVMVTYETRRSAQGAGVQRVAYSLNGVDFRFFRELVVTNGDPVVHQLDFRPIPQADNNPDFRIRIHFDQGAGGTEGNNRFDNVAVVGTLFPGLSTPPLLLSLMPNLETVALEAPESIDLRDYFEFGEDDSIAVISDHPEVLSATASDGIVQLTPLSQGEADVLVRIVNDQGAEARTTFRVLVYPAPHRLSEHIFRFVAWDADEPEMAFPEAMLFLQSEVSDPGLHVPLTRAYRVPHHDHHADDQHSIGFPYNNTSRTRMNGLGPRGVSFINTGRDRDLGGALVALDTRGLADPAMSWLAGTVRRSNRTYAISLQYRTAIDQEFRDIADTTYWVGGNGEAIRFTGIPLPDDARDQPYVQLLWRYYHVSGDNGARPEMRLDEIAIGENVVTGAGWVVY